MEKQSIKFTFPDNKHFVTQIYFYNKEFIKKKSMVT